MEVRTCRHNALLPSVCEPKLVFIARDFRVCESFKIKDRSAKKVPSVSTSHQFNWQPGLVHIRRNEVYPTIRVKLCPIQLTLKPSSLPHNAVAHCSERRRLILLTMAFCAWDAYQPSMCLCIIYQLHAYGPATQPAEVKNALNYFWTVSTSNSLSYHNFYYYLQRLPQH